MGNPRSQYLIRAADGTMATISAFSIRGALQDYIDNEKNEVEDGDDVSVKKRGEGDWEHFRVSVK